VYASKKLCDVFGNYRQSHENFEEPDNDPGAAVAKIKAIKHRRKA
jgi:hypothetical protein